MRRALCFLLIFSMLLLGGCEMPDTGTHETPGGDKTENTLPTLTTVVFSIGKADAILIYNEQHAILIDAGEVEDAAEILAYLKKEKIEQLDALILTHYDKDHVGGAAGVIEGIAIKEVYGTYQSKKSEEYDRYQEALASKSLTPTVVSTRHALLYDALKLVIYPPHENAYEEKESNNSSLVIHMTYGETTYLFGGDAQELRIRELLEEHETSGLSLDCDFMKVPYHGNPLENLPALLAITTPDYAVITCSDKNPVDPSKTAALRDAGARVFLTRAGNVYATSNGKTLTVRH